MPNHATRDAGDRSLIIVPSDWFVSGGASVPKGT